MQIDNAEIEWLDNGLPYSTRFEDVYFSRDDACGESLHVFIRAQQLQQRWQAGARECFIIGELGFGCGLNFLQTWHVWRQWHRTQQARPDLQLHYIACELHPLAYSDLVRVLDQLTRSAPQLASLGKKLLAHYPDHSRGCHRLLLDDGLILDLHYGDALACLQSQADTLGVDAWYADGFSPKHNPTLWQQGLFQAVAAHSATNATLSTYSVAGSVRRHLQAAEFKIEKRPGFGDKREMLWATLPAKAVDDQEARTAEPWFQLPAPQCSDKTVMVIGAGLAGCSTAFSLARRGWTVSVIDAHEPLAGASGNRQLALRCRLIADHSPLAGFYLHSFLYSRRLIRQLLSAESDGWHECGVIQLDDAINKLRKASHEKLSRLYPSQVVRRLTEDERRQVIQAELDGHGWLFPFGGWLDPAVFCQACLDHPNIALITGSEVSELVQENEGWHVLDCQGSNLGSAAAVVIACGPRANAFSQTRHLPINVIRGQNTLVAATSASRTLATVVCGQRTVFPVFPFQTAGAHTVSASYDNADDSLEPRSVDNQDNLRLARDNFKDKDVLSGQVLDARVSLRANTPDHSPLLGPVPDIDAMQTLYGDLAHDANTRFHNPGSYWSGLYISAAHGSNGLSTAPFAGEVLAGMITATPVPVSRDVLAALNPVRFLIRDLKKQRF